MRYYWIGLTVVVLSLMQSRSLGSVDEPRFWSFAKTPPMGWNSWDCFGTGVTEGQVRENAEYLSKNLRRHGWKLVTVDICWYVPHATGWDYKPGAEVAMDKYGRLLPAPDRFPSATGGRGFRALAREIHSAGLLFGLHILRGIPRQAVEANLPILGTDHFAADIANRNDPCPWNPDMWGVDLSKPGAQEYYDSVLSLFASWGVDFIKVDDLSSPYHTDEIDAIRHAIDKCGRPIVFSTSPGPTDLDHGAHIEKRANMWRVSNDVWDNWGDLKAQFERLEHWLPFQGPGHWPDGDMLPIGAIRQGQKDDWTHFTKDEQITLLSLWSIARSPLILGSNLPKNDSFTLSLLCNDEVLGVNQRSVNNRQLWRTADQVAWLADVPDSKDKFVALFNLKDLASGEPSTDPVPLKLEDLKMGKSVRIRNLWARQDLGSCAKEFAPAIPRHGAGLYRISPEN